MAVSSDGNRESSVVTKTFFVEEPSQKEVEEEDGEGEVEVMNMYSTYGCNAIYMYVHTAVISPAAKQ